MNDDERKRLMEVCEGATPGPWTRFAEGRTVAVLRDGDSDESIINWPGFDQCAQSLRAQKANAKHIATFDPPTARALLEENERLMRPDTLLSPMAFGEALSRDMDIDAHTAAWIVADYWRQVRAALGEG